MRFLFIVFLMKFVFFEPASALQKSVGAQSKTSKHIITLKRDSSVLEVRKFKENAIQKYRTQKAFIYNDAAPQTVSLWDRFWGWFWGIIQSIFSGGITGKILNYCLTGVVLLLAVFITIKLIGLDYKLFARKSKIVPMSFDESLENIHEIDFDEQVDRAVLSSNYRLAVRLLYLKTLKQLSDQDLIAWKVDKTNQTYVSELSSEIQRKEFALLTNQFERIWYGDFFIDKLSFEEINNAFNQFNTKRV